MLILPFALQSYPIPLHSLLLTTIPSQTKHHLNSVFHQVTMYEALSLLVSLPPLPQIEPPVLEAMTTFSSCQLNYQEEISTRVPDPNCCSALVLSTNCIEKLPCLLYLPVSAIPTSTPSRIFYLLLQASEWHSVRPRTEHLRDSAHTYGLPRRRIKWDLVPFLL